MSDIEYLESLLAKESIALTKRQACQFIEYYNLLVEWNQKINLTAITEFKEVCLKHFLDSLSLVKMFSSFTSLHSSSSSFFDDDENEEEEEKNAENTRNDDVIQKI